MRFPKRQSDGDPAPDQDPLSPYSAPTVRRDRGGTQPLDDSAGGPPRASDTEVGTDFATRQVQRRQRQGGARVYPQRFGEMARKVDNRQLFLIAGGLILLLIALLAYRAYRQRSTAAAPGLDSPASARTTPEPAAQATAALVAPAAGAFVTAVPGDLTQATAPAAPASSGAAFVVSGTGAAGLFLRSDHSTTANSLATLPDGTKVQAIGEEFNDGSRTWKKVKTDKGEGWVAADFLVPTQ